MRWMLLALPLALGACGKEDPAKPAMKAPPARSANRAIDPICHMEVDKTTPHKFTHEGTTYYFCAENCLKEFQSDPKKRASPCRCGKVSKKCPCEHCGGYLGACDCHK